MPFACSTICSNHIVNSFHTSGRKFIRILQTSLIRYTYLICCYYFLCGLLLISLPIKNGNNNTAS